MDVIRITNKEGYRYEDLTEENKAIIDWLNYLVNDIDGFEYDYAEVPRETETTLDRIKNEIVVEAIEKLKDYLKITILEYQISLIENQPEEDENNV